jgi:hypothetical protein
MKKKLTMTMIILQTTHIENVKCLYGSAGTFKYLFS